MHNQTPPSYISQKTQVEGQKDPYHELLDKTAGALDQILSQKYAEI